MWMKAHVHLLHLMHVDVNAAVCVCARDKESVIHSGCDCGRCAMGQG